MGREAGIRGQEQTPVGESDRGSRSGSREDRWRLPPVHRRFGYRAPHNATRNDCDCVASARSDSGAPSIAALDSPVRSTAIRSATARRSSRSAFEKLVVASSST